MEFNVENYLSNLSYINKDFPSLWNEILETVPKLTNKWLPSEANESDPLVVLLKILAIEADKLNYNIDKNVLELFPATLTQLRSAYNVYDSLGYTPDWYKSATTSVTIVYSGLISGSVPDTSYNVNVTIPKFTQVSDDETETIYTILEDVEITPGTPKSITVNAMEGVLNDFTINGTTKIMYNNLDSQNRLYFNEYNVAQNGIIISNNQDFSDYSSQSIINPEQENDSATYWRRVNNLNQYTAGQRIYKLGIDSVNNSVYLQFPDDIGNVIENGIYIKYILSNGEQGNVGRGDITKFANVTSFSVELSDETEVSLSATDDFSITNTKSSQNGSDPLDIDEMRRQFNRVVGTFNTLVTLRDYENYLYNYTDSTGEHIVSNIRVSDRFNDLFDTLSYKTMTEDGRFDDNTVILKDEDGKDRMLPYDLRLYPFVSSSALDSKEDFDTAFNLYSDDNELKALNLEITGQSTGDEAIKVDSGTDSILSEAKCVSHNFKSPMQPIIIPYDLNGQLYLQTSVSSIEATKILQSVETSLYEALNPRELNWGEMIDYGNVVNSIKEADSRIQYVALNPIEYKQPKIAGEAPAEFSEVDNGYNVIERTILSGNKAWTTYSPYYYNYNQENGKWYGNNSGGSGDTGSSELITGITTNISISDGGEETPKNYNLFVVGKNETLTVLVPQYNTKTTYSNYLYYIAQGTTSNIIRANEPTPIPDNCYIYIFTTREKAQSWVSQGTSRKEGADYVISSGTLIQSSVDITFSSTLTEDSIGNMGSSISISIVERAKGTLVASDSVVSSIDSPTMSHIWLATNAQRLSTSLQRANRKYTLLADEYLFYTDALGLELGIVGEGTTVYTTTAIQGGIKVIDNNTDVSKLLNGTTKSNYVSEWTEVSSNIVNYELNDLYTFGEDYAIRCGVISDGNIEYKDYLNSETDANVFFDVVSIPDSEQITNIEYAIFPTDSDGNIVTDNLSAVEWLSVPSISSGSDKYQMLLRMSFISGPGAQQDISKIDEISVTLNDVQFTSPARNQSVILTTSGGEITITPEDEPLYLQSSQIVAYQGGPTLELTGEEQEKFTMYSYTVGGESIAADDSGFIYMNTLPDGVTEMKTPSNSLSVIAYIPQEGGVKYVLTSGSMTINITENEGGAKLATIGDIDGIIAVSIPYALTKSATYYNGSEYVDVSTILGDETYKELTEEYIYYNGYSPLYVPDSDESIDDPEDSSNYFVKQHPYNRYVMPYLDNINIVISPLSIAR